MKRRKQLKFDPSCPCARCRKNYTAQVEHQKSVVAGYRKVSPAITKVGAAAGRRFAPGWLRVKVLKRDRYRCRYCRQRVTNETAQMDHVVPWPEGMTEFANLRTACPECNRKKGRKRLGHLGRGRIPNGVIAHVRTSRWLGLRDSAPEENGPVRVRKVGLAVLVSPPW